jgi:dipeptidyl aminopeptidase/acylaminoacyl peptidase
MGRGLRLIDAQWDESGTLLWLEGRAGRNVLVVQPPGGDAPRDLSAEFAARSRLGYGGGEFSVSHRRPSGRQAEGGLVFFAEAASGRLYRQSLASGTAHPLTPGFGYAASPRLSPDGLWVAFVHSYEGNDSLGIVDVEGRLWPHRLVSGDDFYMQPAWHPDCRRIAWVAWNHPNMPWDGTFLRLGSLAFPQMGLPTLRQVVTLAGSADTAIFQPEFSPDGRSLAYVSDQSGWGHIYLHDLESGDTRQLTHGEAEHGLPAWIQDMRTYGFAPDGKSLVCIRRECGFASLWRLDLETGGERRIDLPPEYTWLEQIAVSPLDGEVVLQASGGRTPKRLIAIHPDGKTRVLRRSDAEDLPPESYSLPEPITWSGMDGGNVYGLFYPPQSEQFEGTGLPPLIVQVHGGPTSARNASFDDEVQFFTSRGYAVLQVNHRGSTGYGRVYQDRLRGNWGVYDVQDSVSGARYLAEAGRVDGTKLVIRGGSAGGFTVLKALEDYPGVFKAGVNLYGVSDQFDFLVGSTHKFEERYNDTMLGPFPEAATLYKERSPLFFVDQIQDPIAVFQGEDDIVVPRHHSDAVVESLKRRGVPHVYHLYPGEGHGFSKPETIEHYYTEVEKFLRQYVIYT